MFAHFDGVGEARGVHSTAITTVFELLRKIRKSVGCSYTNEPVTDLNNAYEDFIEALRNLFTPPAQTQAEDIPTDTESGGAPELPWQTFIEDCPPAGLS